MSDSDRFFPHVSPRTDGNAALERFRRAHVEHGSRIRQVEQLGAQALVSAATVLGVDPVTLGFGLRDGQIATALTAGEPLVSSEIAERRLEIAIACIAGWAEELARRVRREGDVQATRLDRLAGEVRQEWGRMQHLLYREGTVRQTRPFSRMESESRGRAGAPESPIEATLPEGESDLALRERIATLVLQLERSQSTVTERNRAIERVEDERLRLRVRVQELEVERNRLQEAVAGWKEEATRKHGRGSRRDAGLTRPADVSPSCGLERLLEEPVGIVGEGSLGVHRDVADDYAGSASPRWMAEADAPLDPEPPGS